MDRVFMFGLERQYRTKLPQHNPSPTIEGHCHPRQVGLLLPYLDRVMATSAGWPSITQSGWISSSGMYVAQPTYPIIGFEETSCLAQSFLLPPSSFAPLLLHPTPPSLSSFLLPPPLLLPSSSSSSP